MITNDVGITLRRAKSMEYFADGEPTLNFGEWRNWEKECVDQGRIIPPEEFKKEYRQKK